MRFRWIAETDVPTRQALATSAALYHRLGNIDSPPAWLYGARLAGDAVVIGRNQRATDALDVDACAARGVDVVRRATGGPACVAGHGILYFALGLRHGSVLMECPGDRVLNRNVRGFLGGLALTGARANYFGREWIAVDKRPAALLGWTRDAEGGVLVEAFLSVDRPYWLPDELSGYPTREEMTLSAMDPILMSDVWDEPRKITDIVRLIAEGHVDRFRDVDFDLDHSSMSDEERQVAAEAAGEMAVGFDQAWDSLAWSEVREVPVGFISAGLALDQEGLVEDVRVAGDFYQDEAAPAVLAKKLVGATPTKDAFTAAVAAAWDGQHRVVEGFKDPAPVVEALAEAAATC